MRPTWIEISLDNLRHNFDVVQRQVGNGVIVCAVAKADGYGHGAVECARVLEDQGARWIGVTSLDEAVPLRDAGIQARILLMTGFIPGEEEEVVRLGLTPTVWESGQVERLEKGVCAGIWKTDRLTGVCAVRVFRYAQWDEGEPMDKDFGMARVPSLSQ